MFYSIGCDLSELSHDLTTRLQQTHRIEILIEIIYKPATSMTRGKEVHLTISCTNRLIVDSFAVTIWVTSQVCHLLKHFKFFPQFLRHSKTTLLVKYSLLYHNRQKVLWYVNLAEFYEPHFVDLCCVLCLIIYCVLTFEEKKTEFLSRAPALAVLSRLNKNDFFKTRPTSAKVKCIVFWPAFGCWVNPKADWYTFVWLGLRLRSIER